MKARRGRGAWDQFLLDWSRIIAYWLILIGGLGVVATLAYLGYGLFSGHFADFTRLPYADQLRYQQNVMLATRGLYLAAMALAAGLLLWNPGQFGSGYALTAGGALLFFGVPFLLRDQLGTTSTNNQAIYALSYYLISSGRTLLFIGLASCVLDTVVRVFHGWKEFQKRRAERAKFELPPGEGGVERDKEGFHLPFTPHPCWALPVCRDYMMKVCDSYHERCSCWKKKTGCLCDASFMIKVLEGTRSYKKSDLNWLLGDTQSTERTLTCGRCPIFNEHQREKFALLASLALPVGLLVGYVSTQQVHHYYQLALQLVGRAIFQISFAPGDQARATALSLIQSMQSSAIEWMLVATLALWSMHLYHRLMEILILKVKV